MKPAVRRTPQSYVTEYLEREFAERLAADRWLQAVPEDYQRDFYVLASAALDRAEQMAGAPAGHGTLARPGMRLIRTSAGAVQIPPIHDPQLKRAALNGTGWQARR